MTTYRTVRELTERELDELRDNYFWGEETQGRDYYESQSDIPDSVLFEHYEGISFVKDDFWVNLNK